MTILGQETVDPRQLTGDSKHDHYKDPARSEKIAGEERAQQFSNGGRGPSKPIAENGWQKKVRQKCPNLSQL